MFILASAPLHTQDTEIGLGALVWQPQPLQIICVRCQCINFALH